MCPPWASLLLVVFLGFLPEPSARSEPPAATARGEHLLDAYFRSQTQRVADACLAGVNSREDWERRRPELRRQFLEMLGLWPLPPRTDLRPVITGKLATDRFNVEKLHFQSSPGLYVTANLYIPRHTLFPAPTILYLCGHAPVVVNGISYGCKVHYQHHAIWFAEHGYVCLVLDTLQLGEIPGLHHGTSRYNLWGWQTLGYTPAGVECWNALRALDYLETRPEVDRKRIGVTGRSGGGATSWWVAAADDRLQCIAPVAGIADLWAHVVEGVVPPYRKGVISGHCDCMYFVNTYRWDFPLVAALCAPRPLLLGNSTADAIFPAPGYRRLAEKVARVYDLYGAGGRFLVWETPGPHQDTVEMRRAVYRWMNRWLQAGGDAEESPPHLFSPQQLKVLDRIPDDAINARVHETFVKPAHVELPQVPAVARAWWPLQRAEWLQALREKVFRGWPAQPPPLAVRQAADVRHDGCRLRAYDYTSEEGVELRLWLLTAAGVEKPTRVVFTAVDEAGWQEGLKELGPAFREALQVAAMPGFDAARFARNRRLLERRRWALATVAPRGIGPTRWAEPGSPTDRQVRRRFPLLGQTLDGQRVWDIRRALAVLRTVPELRGLPLTLEGKREAAGLVLYAALFEPDGTALDLWQPPASHEQGPIFLNVRRFFDMPQAVALAFPRAVCLHVPDEIAARAWAWPLELQRQLGKDFLKIQVGPEG